MEKRPGPFELELELRQVFLLGELLRLTEMHYAQCAEYRRLIDILFGGLRRYEVLEDVPFIPVRLFKNHDLLSIPPGEVVKTMTSSGTTGQRRSKIFLDKFTAALQIKLLASIVSSFIGNHRLPMLVIDSKSTVSNRVQFSARAAGILGFSMFGRDVTYALDENMEIEVERVKDFLQRNQAENILVFGFTSIVWDHFIREVHERDLRLNLDNGILIHGGGWKKLEALAIGNDQFKRRLFECTGLQIVHNYYGMVEQTGSIFMECEQGRLHSSSYSDIIIRDPIDFRVCEIGKPGLIQLLSVIPHSYPGHSILSEDIGELVGVDDCPCMRFGKTFKVLGRVKNAEVRGCSDTYSA